MKNEKVKKFFAGIWNVVSSFVYRFPVAIMLSAATTVFACITIFYSYSYKEIRNICSWGIKASLWAFLPALLIQLLCETFWNKVPVLKKKLFRFISQLVLGAGSFAFWFFLEFTGNGSVYTGMVFYAFLVAFSFGLVFLLAFRHEGDSVSIRFFTSLVFSFIIFLAIGGGLSIVASAFILLILNKDSYNVLENTIQFIIYFSGLFVFINSFFAFLTTSENPNHKSKIMKVFFNYILLPLYTLLILVLYIYFAKCLILRSLPGGRINWFVSFATVFYLIFFYALKGFETKSAELFYKAGAYIMFPLIIIQCVAVFIRVHAYGFTGPRFASLAYIIVSTAFIIFTAFKNKRSADYGILFFVITPLILTLPGINFIDAPHKGQTKRLEKLLMKHGILENGLLRKVKPETEIPEEDLEKMESAFREVYMWDKAPAWSGGSSKNEYYEGRYVVYDLIGVKRPNESYSNSKYFSYSSKIKALKLEGVSYISEVKKEKQNEARILYYDENGNEKIIDLADEILELVRENRLTEENLLFTGPDNEQIYITQIDGTINDDEEISTLYTLEGFILW